jgi:dTDP-4-dehydrorhamnose reductase
MKVLVLGANGMLGSTLLRVLSEFSDWLVTGTVRSESVRSFFAAPLAQRLISNIDLTNTDSLTHLFREIRPNIVINCAGLTKHVPAGMDKLSALTLNALLPHRLAEYCGMVGARLVHISTDCVFSGTRGDYSEEDQPDAQDLYGRTKLLGEVDYSHAITLRTSIIGHELHSPHGLIEWFLSQKDRCKGYTRAIFSGLPTVVLSAIIRDVVVPRADLHGVYHVAAKPIAKYDLLQLVAQTYGKAIDIIPDSELKLDRSLNGNRFCAATGWDAPSWPDLVKTMNDYR